MAEPTRNAHEMFLGKAFVAAGPIDHAVYQRENRHEEAVLEHLSRKAGVPNLKIRLEPESDGAGEDGERLVLEEIESPEGSSSLGGIDSLIAPLDIAEFATRQHGDPRPVIFRGRDDRFAGLVTWDDLNEIVCLRNLRPPLVHLIADGRETADYLYQVDNLGLGSRQPGPNVSRIDGRKLANFLRTGSTLIVNAIQEYHPPVARLARDIEGALATYVNVNLYASWHSTRGFATHWDDHDVFVIQVTGAKEWRLFKPTRSSPTSYDSQPTSPLNAERGSHSSRVAMPDYGHHSSGWGAPASESPPHPAWVGTLTAGDVLFIPRGWWHDARVDCADEGVGSVHLTLGTRTVTGTWILRWLERKLLDHELFRRNTPLAADETVRSSYFAAVADLIRGQLHDDFGERFAEDVRAAWTESTRTALSTYIEPWKSPDWDAFELSLRGRRQAVLDVPPGTGSFWLRANGLVREFDVYCLDLLRMIADRESIPVGELKTAHAGRFAIDFVDDFVRQLLKEDVVFVNDPGGQAL